MATSDRIIEQIEDLLSNYNKVGSMDLILKNVIDNAITVWVSNARSWNEEKGEPNPFAYLVPTKLAANPNWLQRTFNLRVKEYHPVGQEPEGSIVATILGEENIYYALPPRVCIEIVGPEHYCVAECATTEQAEALKTKLVELIDQYNKSR